MKNAPLLRTLFSKAVCVAALGYFVDLYDLVLFGIVRVPSLKALGVPEAELLSAGTRLLNLQMAGLLVGGFAWGLYGDRFGRMRTLFGSIFLYSVANIANAFVTGLPVYGLLRFLAGIGLAGELGAAVTLVSEILPLSLRGLGSTVIGLAGFLGAISAAYVGGATSWKTSYILGGVLGLVLLTTRLSVGESEFFKKTLGKPGQLRAGLHALIVSRERFSKYLRCLVVGTPIWFVAGFLIYFSPEFARELGVTAPISAGQAILWSYIGSFCGDLLSGVLSHRLRSRKKAILGFSAFSAVLIPAYFIVLRNSGPTFFYFFCFLLGVACGYWTLFVAMSSEQFGTNIRATVTTSIPNLVRAMVIPMMLVYQQLKPTLGITQGALWIGVTVSIAALLALASLPETFHKDLDYFEGLLP